MDAANFAGLRQAGADEPRIGDQPGDAHYQGGQRSETDETQRSM